MNDCVCEAENIAVGWDGMGWDEEYKIVVWDGMGWDGMVLYEEYKIVGWDD